MFGDKNRFTKLVNGTNNSVIKKRVNNDDNSIEKQRVNDNE